LCWEKVVVLARRLVSASARASQLSPRNPLPWKEKNRIYPVKAECRIAARQSGGERMKFSGTTRRSGESLSAGLMAQ